MIIVNITFQVEWEIHESWLVWLKVDHIPAVLSHGLFYDAKILRLLQLDETEGPTYAVQFHAENHEDYQRYETEHGTHEKRKITLKWGSRIVYFSSVMSVVQ